VSRPPHRRAADESRLLSGRQAIGLLLAAGTLALGWLIAPPDGFSVQGWHAAATLLAIVPVMVFGSLPDGAVALVLIATWVLGGVASPGVALGGFASSTWMLTIAVFVVGAVIASSGLLFRLALWSIEHARGGFKVETLALCLTGWLSSAAVPNPSGRMLLAAPAVTEMAEACGYAPGSRPAAGLAMAALLGFGQTVAPFLTSSTTTLLTFTLLPEASRSGLDWVSWALRAAPTYAVLLLGMLAFIIWRYSPRTAVTRRTDALPVQRVLLGPVSRQEWVSGVVTLILLACFATQPLHHVDPAWIALSAVGVLAAVGLVTPDTLRSVNWNYALLFGTLASMVDVFAATSLDRSLANLIAGALSGVSSSPLVFVTLLTLVCFAASFVLRFAAAAPLISVALAPVASSLGIDPWVVAIVALVGTSGFFLPYQSTIYQAVHQELNGRLFQHAQVRPVAVMYGVLSLVAIAASVPVWHLMGLL
jgi:di/tricarboxylate transporter